MTGILKLLVMLRKIYIGFQEHGQGWERNNYKGGIPKDLQESLQGAGHYESSKEKDIERKKSKSLIQRDDIFAFTNQKGG